MTDEKIRQLHDLLSSAIELSISSYLEMQAIRMTLQEQGILNENLLTQKRAYLEELWKKEVPEAQVRAQSDRVEAMRERLLEFLSKFEGTKN